MVSVWLGTFVLGDNKLPFIVSSPCSSFQLPATSTSHTEQTPTSREKPDQSRDSPGDDRKLMNDDVQLEMNEIIDHLSWSLILLFIIHYSSLSPKPTAAAKGSPLIHHIHHVSIA